MLERLWGVLVLGVLLALVVSSFVSVAYAETPQSPNYRFDETSVGSGGFVQSSSTSYRADAAAGDLAIGNAASSNYQVEAGSKTTNEPNLTVSINGIIQNFAPFSAGAASTATSSFSISNYTAYGYVVQIIGDTLRNGSNSIAAMTTAGPSSTGTDQFGMNLVANTSPASVGSNPVYELFGVGTVAGNYATPNQFRFVSGDTIAVANKSSGKTTYTITYLANVDSLTPGGQYKADHTIVVTGTY